MNEPAIFKPRLAAAELHEKTRDMLVRHLERLLEQAKSGELTALAYAIVLRDNGKPDGAWNHGIAVGPMCTYATTHALRGLQLAWAKEAFGAADKEG